jgi:hypothetical protein
VQPPSPTHHYGGVGETPKVYGYLNIHHACESGSDDRIILTGASFDSLLNHPKAFGFDTIDEIYDSNDVTLGRVKLMYGPDAKEYAAAFFNGDAEKQTILMNSAKSRVRETLLNAQKPGIFWVPNTQWNFVPQLLSPRQWYPENRYRPTVTGLARSYVVIFALLRRNHGGFQSLSNDLFRFLMYNYLIRLFATDIWEAFLRHSKLHDSIISASETETSEDV